ncbi:MAG: carboxyl-terminal processing protease [Desulforhopalus sp.]|jgi:carboxyl-terminal processing protease
MKNYTRHTMTVFLMLLFFTTSSGFAEDTQEFDLKRNTLIGYMLYKALPAVHFSHKEMNESLSGEIFSLYLKQLDYQKRLLLSSDVTELRSYAHNIADDLGNGTNVLPKTGYDILKKRIGQVEKMVDQIMSAGFDVKSDEVYETDPEKIGYAIDLKGLEDRWRKIMRAQVMYSYLELAKNHEKTKVKLPDDELWKLAKEEESKVIKDFFLRLNKETLQNHYDRFFNAIARSFDPHTEYLPPTKIEELDIQMRGNLEGVGATLRDENGFNKVVSIVPGGPAAKQGMLQAEDIILQMEEKGATPVDISDMRPGDAARLIRGAKGTEVLLTVKKPDGTKQVIPIIRDVVQIEDTFVKDTVIDAPDGGKIGYILIPSFYRDFEKTNSGEDARNAADDTRKAIKDLAKSKLEGIIIDLRNDGGGSLIDAVDIAGLFIKSGPVVQVKASNGKIQVLNDDDDNIEYSGPLVVLVNKFSASAAEIVAAALQDYKRAIIVGGEHTYGKGTVQNTMYLNKNLRASVSNEVGDLGALKLTTKKFYRITGGSTQYKGFAPDIVLPSLFQHRQSGEKYLDYSLPWDEIGPVKYTAFSNKPFYLDMIRKKSLQRTELDPALQNLAQEAKMANGRSKQTTVSLKLADACQKMEEADTERKSLSDQFQNSQTVLYDGVQLQTTNGKDMKLDEALSWKEELQQDSYVGEAMNIIADMKRQMIL